uniref:Cilia and flagella associated protein 92 (putative) n=1 Tax=Prolemur simus TaxID=1328070 RepID=A0A8C8Z5G6_PROSS
MSLKAWQWEDEDRPSLGPISSVNSLYPSPSECDIQECLKATVRAQASDSDFESSSFESSEESGGTLNSDMPQVVPCKFVISLAFPVNMGHKGKRTSLFEKYKKHPKMDNTITKMRHFYHLEYFLLPDDEEPKEVDMVLFPTVAKVFLELGVKTVKPWREGDKLWVSWAQAFTISVTKELLKKINFHKITLRLWNTKDKLSKKARYYRLKTTTHVDDMGSSEEVRRLVTNHRGFSAQGTAKASIVTEEQSHELPPAKHEKPRKPSKPLQGCSHQTEPETPCKNTEEYEKSLKTYDPSTVRWSISRTQGGSLAGATMMEIKELIEQASFSNLTNLLDRKKSQTKGKDLEGKKKIPKRSKKFRADQDMTLAQAGPWKPSVFSLQLAVTPLLAGEQTVVSRGSDKAANILDCLLMLKTDVPIMTEEQKQDLNPLTIKIKCVSCLPAQPVPIQELERLCVPVYCKYKFHKTPVHKTEGQPHAPHVRFQDINVIFLGAMAPGDLREYLEGPPMAVEVHDRDRASEECARKPTLFGDDPLDSHLNGQSLIRRKDTETNPFESHDTLWDPYGVARVSFADLLLGHKYLNLAVPIQACEPQPAHGGGGDGDRARGGRSRRVVAGFRVPTDGAQRGPMPAGHYVEAESVLKVRVDVAVPLSTGAAVADPQPGGTRFGRIVFVFDVAKPALVHGLLQDIAAINADALGLASFPAGSVQQVLSAFKMRVTIRDRPQLDAVTGFHLLDGRVHVLVLEGLADQGLRRLWHSHQSRWVACAERGGYKVLYNSQLLFRHRLYVDLETVLYHVHLFRPVAQLVRHTALYLRKAMPRSAFRAVARIHEICRNSRDLREVIVRDLLPSAAMIKDLSQEFGMPLSQEELADEKLLALPPQPAPNLEDFRSHNSTLTSEILKNIREAYQPGAKPPKPVAKAIKIAAPARQPVCNYSIQALNAAELAKKELYREMAKEPRKRFTYSQNFLSATVEPVDVEEEERKAQRMSRQAWLTASGFQVTGLKSGIGGSHQPGLGLPLLKEPAEEWTENALFANKLRPVLDRDRWGWDRRHLDFELYKKPPPFLELPPRPAPKPATGKAGPFAASCVGAWLSRLRWDAEDGSGLIEGNTDRDSGPVCSFFFF